MTSWQLKLEFGEDALSGQFDQLSKQLLERGCNRLGKYFSASGNL